MCMQAVGEIVIKRAQFSITFRRNLVSRSAGTSNKRTAQETYFARLSKAKAIMTKGQGTSRGALWQARTLMMLACCVFVCAHPGGKSKRYVLESAPWPKHDLTYKITRYTEKLSQAAVDSEIARAFAVWSEHANLLFTLTTGEPDFEITFKVDNHTHEHRHEHEVHHHHSNGKINFDDAKLWTVNSTSGTNLFSVAAHTIGHVLGLGHSYVNSTIMGKVGRYIPNFSLGPDDIAGIQALYGAKPSAA